MDTINHEYTNRQVRDESAEAHKAKLTCAQNHCSIKSLLEINLENRKRQRGKKNKRT